MEREEGAPRVPEQEPSQDPALRPKSLEEFIGQPQVVSNLRVCVDAARLRGDPVDHILLSGLPGLGKTTLAEIISREMGAGFRATSGPVLDRPADLAGLLTGLSKGDVLFIDEIHRMPTTVEEYLYSAMEDFRLIIVLDQGPRARTIPVQINPFTLVGATTREGLLSSPFRSRFGIHERLEPYPLSDLVQVAQRSARLLGLTLDAAAATLLAKSARGAPRLVNRYLRRLRDLAQVRAETHLELHLAKEGLERLGLDEFGLLHLDRRLLSLLHDAGLHPVGLKTLAAALGEEERTIEDVYEPFLLREGYLAKTTRGRTLTEKGRRILCVPPPQGSQGRLFED